MKTTILLALFGVTLLGAFAAPANATESHVQRSSVLATWNCTSTPCPWGDQTSGQAVIWPAAAEPIRARHGYTVSHDVYATAQKVLGWTITVTTGNASVYAGPPNGSHSSLATLETGHTYTVPALSAGYVLSLQSGDAFHYTLIPGTPPTEQPTEQPSEQPTEQPDDGSSVLATWMCTSTPCPWGEQTSDQAVVWPATAEPTRARHGYTVSHDVYAPAQKLLGWTITVTTGNASVYAGPPTGSHSSLATLEAGQNFTVPALSAGDVVSVQSGDEFRYTVEEGALPPSSPPPMPACTDPTACDPVSWVASEWRYNGPGPDPGPWIGGVIAWPSWSAYSSNNRTDLNSRSVFSTSGEKLYPYMGSWADGCEVKVVSGGVLIIEWERGRDDWRETALSAGDTYTITLMAPENGAMIETQNNSEPFEVSLANCTPEQIDKGSSD